MRAVIVGAGLMGRWHADAITHSGGLITHILDPHAQRAAMLARRYHNCHVATDLESVLQRDCVDVAHICSPVETHEALARTALRAGVHVLVEKPLAQRVGAARDLLQQAESRGLLINPIHQFVFQPGVRRALWALRRIGPLMHIDAVACSAGADGRSISERDRIAAEILPHPLSLLARLCPEEFAQMQWQLHHPGAGEVRAIGMARTVSVSILVSMRGRPTANILRLIGQRGTAHVDLFHGFCVLEDGATSRFRKLVHPFVLSAATLQAATTNLCARAVRGESSYPGLRELIRRFYTALRHEVAPPLSQREILDVAVAYQTLTDSMSTAPTCEPGTAAVGDAADEATTAVAAATDKVRDELDRASCDELDGL